MNAKEKSDLLKQALNHSLWEAQQKAVKDFEGRYEVKVLFGEHHKIEAGMAIEMSYLTVVDLSDIDPNKIKIPTLVKDAPTWEAVMGIKDYTSEKSDRSKYSYEDFPEPLDVMREHQKSTSGEIPIFKTSEEWYVNNGDDYVILTPDGWDIENYEYSFNQEKITKEEYDRRLAQSTVSYKSSYE